MEKSQVATINLASLTLATRMAEEIYLTQYGLMAERHWRKEPERLKANNYGIRTATGSMAPLKAFASSRMT